MTRLGGSSARLFDALAPTYDEHFAVPARRAYDDLAWRATRQVLPPPPGPVIDVGCGVGRWAERLADLGYRTVGIEPAPIMAETAARRLAGRPFQLLRCTAEEADLPGAAAAVVVAMGSVQYADDPAVVLRQARGWLRPGGVLCLLVDSLIALVVELLRAGREQEAGLRLASRRGRWRQAGEEAELHLLDAAGLEQQVALAGLVPEGVYGLLVGASVHGREELTRRLAADYEVALTAEWQLAHRRELADLGKQLLVVARRPSTL